MLYSNLIQGQMSSVYQAGIATKIIQHMNRIRNVSDHSQARRWIMELLQNSRDVSYPDQFVRVRVELNDDTLTFSHNGRPFRVKDILSIINQVSSKSSDEDTVGQFGTGFISTFLLSEQVELHSVLKDGELPYKPFSLVLDRSGTTNEEILESITRSIEQLEKADEDSEISDFDQNDFNTTFIYHLKTAENRETARTGMDDLADTVPFVLLFSEKIGSIELVYHTSDCRKTVRYERIGVEMVGDLSVLKMRKCLVDAEGAQTETEKRLVYLSGNGLTLAAPVDEKNCFLPLTEKTPRLFIDFPLIGAEKFPFPVVINSLQLHPNEPRSGITLVDNANSADSAENKKIIMKAADLYGELLARANERGFGGFVNVVSVDPEPDAREISLEWASAHIYHRLYRIIAGLPLVDTEKGRVCMKDQAFRFTSYSSEEERRQLAELVAPLADICICSGTEDWYAAMSGYGLSEAKILALGNLLENAQSVAGQKLDRTRMSPLEWCGKLYSVCMGYPELAVDIKAGDRKIFLSQAYQPDAPITLYGVNDLKKDTGIPDALKQATDALDKLVPSCNERQERCPLQIRSLLLHKDFDEKGLSGMADFEESRLINYISVRSAGNYRVKNRDVSYYMQYWKKAWEILLSCGNDEKLYKLYREYSKAELPEYKSLEEKWFPVMRNAFRSVVEKLADAAGQCGSLDALASRVSDGDADRCCLWLNGLVEEMQRYISQSLPDRSVFPSQTGAFCSLRNLYVDKIKHETLKHIVCSFKSLDSYNNILERLADKRIKLDNLAISAMTDSDAANRINNAVSQILSNSSLSEAKEEYQDACTDLLCWIRDHMAEAGKLFPAYSGEEEQMKLLTTRAAARLQQKATEYQNVLEKFNCKDSGDLEKVLERGAGIDALLKQYGCSSVEELAEAFAENRKADTEDGSSSGYDEENDVYFGDEFIDCPKEDMRAYCHEIGLLGETSTLQFLKDRLVKEGFEVKGQTGHEIVLQNDARSTVIEYPDTARYHQSGWDICVRLTDEEGSTDTHYYEVKAHTTTSKLRNYIKLSNEQMKCAVRNKENYTVVMPFINFKEKKAAGFVLHNDPVNCIGSGRMQNLQGGFEFMVSGKEELIPA